MEQAHHFLFRPDPERPPMVQLLLAEDDPILGRRLHVTLETEGYAVEFRSDEAGVAKLEVRDDGPGISGPRAKDGFRSGSAP